MQMSENAEALKPKIVVGVSSCLLGERVRFDGGHKQNPYIIHTLGQYFKLQSFCPEMSIGLGVPRPTLRIVRSENGNRCVGVKDPLMDVTDRLVGLVDNQCDWLKDLCGYIFKKGSPSCGMERVKVYSGQQVSADGQGVYAKRLMENFPLLPVEEEGRLGDPGLRENFIRRVYVMYRWKRLCALPLTVSGLMAFHSQHKLIVMSHDQNACRELGKMVADSNRDNLVQVAQQYVIDLMGVLKKKATRGNHVNVLQHIQGYLKRDLTKGDKEEMTDVIEQYRLGYLPLIVPITLLKHHFRKAPDPFIDQSLYMSPFPRELCLLNTL